MSFGIRSIKEANSLQTCSMNNKIEDFIILRGLGVSSRPCKAPKILLLSWLLPSARWIKINTNSVAGGAPGVTDGGGIFCTMGALLMVVSPFFWALSFLLRPNSWLLFLLWR